jgi:hypothetical protein
VHNVLIVADSLIPTLLIGLIRPYIELEKQKKIILTIKKSNSITDSDISWCDVGVFCRSQSGEELRVLFRLKEKNKKVIYDVDDNFFHIPIETTIGQYHASSPGLFTLETFLQFADLVTVYSPTLLNQVKSYNENAVYIKCYFDEGIIDGVVCPVQGGKIKIAYATGRAADDKVEGNVEKALARICEEYGEIVELNFWRKPAAILSRYRCIKQNPIVPNYEKFIRSFYQGGFDIGLAPLIDDVFYNSKTNNKYREYGGCRVAGIYSDVSVYGSCITDGKNGLLVKENSEAEWFNAIERLICDENLRKLIVENALLDIKEHYSFSDSVNTWAGLLVDLCGKESVSCLANPLSRKRWHRTLRFPVKYTQMGNGSIDSLNSLFTLLGNSAVGGYLANDLLIEPNYIPCYLLAEYEKSSIEKIYNATGGVFPAIIWLVDLPVNQQKKALASASELGLNNACIVTSGNGCESQAATLRFHDDLIVVSLASQFVGSGLGVKSALYGSVVIHEAIMRLDSCKYLKLKPRWRRFFLFPYADVWKRVLTRMKTNWLYYKVSKLKRL